MGISQTMQANAVLKKIPTATAELLNIDNTYIIIIYFIRTILGIERFVMKRLFLRYLYKRICTNT